MPPSAFYSGVNQRQRTDERTTIDMSLSAEDMEAYYECNAALEDLPSSDEDEECG